MKTPLEKVLAEKGRSVHSVAPGDSAIDAVRAMKEKKIGAVLVLDGERPVGIFTERDVLSLVADGDRDLATLKVSQVMTANLCVVSPQCTVEEAMSIFTDKRCRHLPVLEGERLAGIISSGDLTRWLTRLQKLEIESLIEYIHGPKSGS